ncbi:2-hydroxyacid dehydrogenase [Pseudomonas umsongensis]|uniref:2-hydroxyacid dehydrogenase n=1 Tax=Pseudomonas umsongensis TaxID=198618 RepID=UPI003D7F6DFC
MRAVFLDYSSVDLGDLDATSLRAAFTELQLYEFTEPTTTAERLEGSEVAISVKVVIDETVMNANPQLKLILAGSTGTNHIDLYAARARGITVCNCQGYGTPSVAQHTMMLLLALATNLPRYHSAVNAGKWQEARQFCMLDFPIIELEGKTLGLIGYGELGKAVARLAEAFGMTVLIGQLPNRPEQSDRHPLAELLPRIDALTLHCPLNEQTRNLIGATELALMKPGAFVVNTGRGGLIDEQALADALRRGHLGGAATDVLTVEPPSAEHPLLADIPRLILTPHCAWGSKEARQRILSQLGESARSFSKGESLRVVN